MCAIQYVVVKQKTLEKNKMNIIKWFTGCKAKDFRKPYKKEEVELYIPEHDFIDPQPDSVIKCQTASVNPIPMTGVMTISHTSVR